MSDQLHDTPPHPTSERYSVTDPKAYELAALALREVVVGCVPEDASDQEVLTAITSAWIDFNTQCRVNRQTYRLRLFPKFAIDFCYKMKMCSPDQMRRAVDLYSSANSPADEPMDAVDARKLAAHDIE